MLTLGFACRPVRQQVINGERLRVSDVSVQRMHHRWSFLHDPHPRVAMAMDPTLVPLGQAEPALQIQIVLEVIQVVPACKEAGAEAVHQTGHRLVDRRRHQGDRGSHRSQTDAGPISSPPGPGS